MTKLLEKKERTIHEIVEEFVSEKMNKTFIREKGRPKEDGYMIESYSIPFKTALKQTLQTERQKRDEMVEEAIKQFKMRATRSFIMRMNDSEPSFNDPQSAYIESAFCEALTQPNNPKV